MSKLSIAYIKHNIINITLCKLAFALSLENSFLDLNHRKHNFLLSILYLKVQLKIIFQFSIK
jgi:hypothetical protein